MSKIFTPTNQIRLTNVATVRLKKGGLRFEVACYKNKVLSWRSKTETDIDEVLHTHTVFTNVSKGQVAKNEDLVKVFGTNDKTKICLEILEKGELQVSDKERAAQLENLTREVATIIADKCVDPERKRPYSVALILKAMKDAHFSPNVNKAAKPMALEMIPKLKAIIPIEKAQMKVKVSLYGKETSKFRGRIVKMGATIENEKFESPGLTMVLLIDPGLYRQIEELCTSYAKSEIELLSLKETVEEEFL